MPKRRSIRRLAMQLMYQLDLRGSSDAESICQNLLDGPDPPEVCKEAWPLAQAAWREHSRADMLARELAPDWPTNRQPPVDRAILRLAYYEIVSGWSPTKVAINEAIELAKQYSAEQAPAFINGVLDKMAKRLSNAGDAPEPPAVLSAGGDESPQSVPPVA